MNYTCRIDALINAFIVIKIINCAINAIKKINRSTALIYTYIPKQLNKWIFDNLEQPFIVATILFWLSQTLLVFLVWKDILWSKEIPTSEHIIDSTKLHLFSRFYIKIHILHM